MGPCQAASGSSDRPGEAGAGWPWHRARFRKDRGVDPVNRRVVHFQPRDSGRARLAGECKPFRDNVDVVALLPVSDVMDPEPVTATRGPLE